jgi:hypothetical protein
MKGRKKESNYVSQFAEYNEVFVLCFVEQKLRHMRDVGDARPWRK